MKIGITGASGQLGRLVIEKLKENTDSSNIIALVRTPKKVKDLGVEVREFDYDKKEQLPESLIGIDKLLLISASEIGKRVPQHKNVIDAAKKAGVGFIAYTSLLKADISSIGLAGEHFQTEDLLKNSNIPFVILRNGWYTENYTNDIKNIISTGTLYASSKNAKISPASRKDFAEAAAIVLTTDGHKGNTYELAGDQSFNMEEYAEEISLQTGKNIPYVNLSTEEYTNLLVKSGIPEDFAHFYAGTDISILKGDLYDNNYQLSNLIGRPTTSLKEIVSEALS